ncbi:MAG TPA: glycosyltransferase [Steroidobacteraceae bacterium]|nr:glycosyltransferase [Steroidobacteraceae bacterium]
MAPTDSAGEALARRSQDSRQTRPRILVLLAAHNGASWIGEQLRSILAQQEVDVRVVVRDDASADETRAQVAPFLDDGRVSLTSGETPSGSAAQNFFALLRENSPANFDFVALADQDDEWFTDKLARAARGLQAGAGAGYSSATLATWPNGRSALLTQSSRATPSDFLFGGMGQGCTFVLTAQFYGRARDFLARHAALSREIHYHDWALYALARAWSLPWIFDPAPSMRYRQHGGNDTGARKSVAGARKRLDLIRSGWYARQLGVIARLCASASPSQPVVCAWHAILIAPPTWSRRVRIARFCLRGGRRGAADNCVILVAALAGWL